MSSILGALLVHVVGSLLEIDAEHCYKMIRMWSVQEEPGRKLVIIITGFVIANHFLLGTIL